MIIRANTFGFTDRIPELISNLKELEEAKRQGSSIVNINRLRWVSPFSIMPIAMYVNNNNMEVTCTDDHDPKNYLDAIGFPNGVTELLTSKRRHLPITRLRPIEQDNVLSEYEDWILQIAGNGGPSTFKTSLKHLTSELVGNVHEHSGVDEYWILAQYHRTQELKCEIIIADCGMGYKDSYKGSEYEAKTDVQAIINALKGRSSIPMPGRGKGIPTIANGFVKGYGGEIVIMSGKAIVHYKQDEIIKTFLKSYWKGALIGIQFNLRKVDMRYFQ